MAQLDVFKADPFQTRSLTDSIIKAPYKPGRIGVLGLFRERGISTTTAMIEEKDGRLSLIQSTPRGGASGLTYGRQGRTARPFSTIHLQGEATINADSIQNVRAWGTGQFDEAAQAEAIQPLVNEYLVDLRAAHEVTLEHLRAGAIQGLVKDADGSTIADLFTEFNVMQQTATVSPDSTADNGDRLRGEVVAAQRLVESELGAEPISGYRAFCGKNFFDAFRADLGVVKTLRFSDPQSLLQQQANARQFVFAGVTWEEYRGATGGTPFFADDVAYLFPEGSNIFTTYFAPADFMETVNTLGLPVYAKIAVDDELQRWAKIHSQSNPLALCTRPRAVIKLTITT
jgi:hypothetical protein